MDVEDAPSKRQKSSTPNQSMFHVFLRVASTPLIAEKDIKEWSFRTEEQVNASMIKVAAELHFHTIQNQDMNAKLRTRLANSKNEKSNLQDKLKKYGDQLTKLKKEKDDEILRLETEMARLRGEMNAMEREVEKVTALNASLQLEKDTLNNGRLNEWTTEKKLVRDESFSHGFNEWCFGFIAMIQNTPSKHSMLRLSNG